MIRHLLAMAGALALPALWFFVHFGALVHEPEWVALSSGAAIFGAAVLLSWASEVAQLDIPRALALIFLALVAVLPEYAVDVYFAWRAGTDPSYVAYATANMTGGNRLLLGVGWAVPVFAVWARFGRSEVHLPKDQAVEVRYLALATLYSFIIPVKGTLTLLDTVLLGSIFIAYLRAASATGHEEPELEGPAATIARMGAAGRRIVVVACFALAGAAILSAAEPFAESLITTGRHLGVEEFLLVQWLAPLASESPEFVVAVLFALKGAAATGIGAMISSKVNQWTLLVGALPAAYALSRGGVHAMMLDGRQREEIFLTAAQSLFGLVIIADFRFALGEAVVLFVLFAAQLLVTSTEGRWAFAAAYLGLSLGMVLTSAEKRRRVLELVRRPGTGA